MLKINITIFVILGYSTYLYHLKTTHMRFLIAKTSPRIPGVEFETIIRRNYGNKDGYYYHCSHIHRVIIYESKSVVRKIDPDIIRRYVEASEYSDMRKHEIKVVPKASCPPDFRKIHATGVRILNRIAKIKTARLKQS